LATILVSSPDDDLPKQYGRYWLEQFAYFAAKHGHRVIFLREPDLETFTRAVKAFNPQFVILNGHGGDRAITGVEKHAILGVASYSPELELKINGSNPELMQGRIVYLFTCHSGKLLASELIRHGARAVAAYKSAFLWTAEEPFDPAEDSKAAPFFYAALMLPRELVLGKTFAQSATTLRKAFAYYLRQAEEQGDTISAKNLNHNLVNFVTFGDPTARLI
jgi:hypothetical protein